MEKRLENKLIMLKAVLSLMQQNQSLWQNSGPLSQAFYELQRLVNLIDQTKQSTNQTNTGLVSHKQNLQEELIKLAFEMASMLYAYAGRINNTVLKAKVDFPISQLRSLRDGELAAKIRNILELRLGHEAELEPYGITQSNVDNLTGLTNQYEQQLPNVRVTVSARKAGNEKIKQLVAEASNVTTDQLDRLMISFKSTQPDFYASYLNARKVVDYGTRHEKTDEEPAPVING